MVLDGAQVDAGPPQPGLLQHVLGVSEETWAQVRVHYDDDQIAALVGLVALINAANRLAVIVHQQGGSYQPGRFAAAVN